MLTDSDLIRSFESCTLPATAFGHREHVRVAWLCLRAAPFERAALRFCTGLRRFADAQGKRRIYHETITWAYLALVNERRDACTTADFDAFADANPDLLDQTGGALAAHYDIATLRTERARRVFLLPSPRSGPGCPGW
jgi:hypothetical protein